MSAPTVSTPSPKSIIISASLLCNLLLLCVCRCTGVYVLGPLSLVGTKNGADFTNKQPSYSIKFMASVGYFILTLLSIDPMYFSLSLYQGIIHNVGAY